MKHLIILFSILAISISAYAATLMGRDGIIYGNICQTLHGWQQVTWQPVGSQCYAPGLNSWGYIANG